MKPLLQERTFNKHKPQTGGYYFDTRFWHAMILYHGFKVAVGNT
jgi:hypothetical protein